MKGRRREAIVIVQARGNGGSDKHGSSRSSKWSDSGQTFKVVTGGLGIGCGRKRRLHDNSKTFDLSNWENRIAIGLDGRSGGKIRNLIMHK